MHPLQTSKDIAGRLSEVPDGELMKKAQDGDQRAFEILVDRYYEPLFGYSHKMLKDKDQTDDILQFVFLQFYLFLPTLETERSLRAWLFRVARNRCIDTLRKQRRELIFYASTFSTEDSEGNVSLKEEILVDPNLLPEEIVVIIELQSLLQRALFTLPPDVRAIVHLHSFKQVSFPEIAKILNIPQPRVKTSFYRSLPRLRAALMQGTSASGHFPPVKEINQ